MQLDQGVCKIRTTALHACIHLSLGGGHFLHWLTEPPRPYLGSSLVLLLLPAAFSSSDCWHPRPVVLGDDLRANSLDPQMEAPMSELARRQRPS